MIDFEINNKLDVFSTENERIGTSLLQDLDEKHLFISIPIERGILKGLRPGRPVKLLYYDEERLYAFEAMIDGSRQDNILLYRVKKPETFEVVQRRQDVRLPIVLDVRYIKIDPIELADFNFMTMDEIEERFDHAFRECLSVDLSGQGIGLVVEEPLRIGERILVLIEHPLLRAALKGRIIRRERLYREGQPEYRIGVRFFDLAFNTKEKIIKFIFDKMREHLKTRKE